MPISDYPPHSRSSSTLWPVFGGMFLGALLIALLLWGFGVIQLGKTPPPPNNPNVKERESAPRGQRNFDEIERIRVNNDAKPSVVNVDTLMYTVNGFNFTEEEQKQGTGSGFFWDDEGRIVTNFHVVRDALAANDRDEIVIRPGRKIMATLSTGDSFQVRLVGVAPDSDLAVIQLSRLPEGGVKKIAVGSSSDLEVGQTVYAIGNPFGQNGTFTHGIISALNRSIQSPSKHIISGAIQTDAALNPGNSGGPLLDKDGRLIGVNTAITSPSGGNVGLGYAIPIDTVNRVVTELIRQGRVAQPFIGAEFVLQEARVRRMGFEKGVMIRSVQPRSPAAVAGLLPGDVIVKVNGESIDGLKDLQRLFEHVKIGDTIALSIVRNGKTAELSLKVEGI